MKSELCFVGWFFLILSGCSVGESKSVSCADAIGRIEKYGKNKSVNEIRFIENNYGGCSSDYFFVALIDGYMLANDASDAHRVLKDSIKRLPDSTVLRRKDMWTELGLKNYSGAKERADIFIGKNPRVADGYLVLATVFAQYQDWQKMYDNSSLAYEISGDPAISLLMVSAQHQLGNHEDAVRIFYRAMELDGALIKSDSGVNEGIYSLASLGRFDEAAVVARNKMRNDSNWRNDKTFVSAVKRLGLE